MTVLPVRSTRRAPGGVAIWPRRPTRENRFPSTMKAEFSLGAVPSPVINRAPSNMVTDEVPTWPCIWGEQAAKKMHDSTIKHRLTSLGIEIPFWLKVERVRKKHRDTKTQRHKGALQGFLCAPLCLCVFVSLCFSCRLNRVCARMIHQAIGVHEHDCYTPGTVQEKMRQ